MFIFPYSTDAILYHRPIGTILLIVANVICFALTGWWAETELARSFELEFNRGMHPLEWVSCHFLHYDVFHLLGNMFFLFVFGLIVEGKIGTFPFLILYFVIGWMGASLAQAMVQWDPDNVVPAAGGASMVIFGLIMIALLWAPKNEVSFAGFVIFTFVPRPIHFEAAVWATGLFYFFLNLFFAWLESFSMGSAMGHLIGGVMGAGIGAAMLQLKWVDCDGWDVFSLMKEDPMQKSMEYYKEERYAAFPSINNTDNLPDMTVSQTAGSGKHRKLVRRVMKSMRKDDPEAAIEARANLSALGGDNALHREEQEEYIKFLLKHKQRDDTIVELQKFVGRFPEDTDRFNLKLCELLITHRKRPAEAMHILATMDDELLDDKLYRKRQKLIRLADEAHAGGRH